MNLPPIFDLIYDIKTLEQLNREYHEAKAKAEQLAELAADHNILLAEKSNAELLEAVESTLQVIYDDYSEYHTKGFHAMVVLFANDAFYKAHKQAKEYLKLI